MKIILTVLMVLLASLAYAQAPAVISVDIAKARFSWSWAQGTGGPVAEFRVKCGTVSGTYPTVKTIVDPAARSLAVNQVISTPGAYFCVVTAANQFGESLPTNEVSFAAGNVPPAPLQLEIVVQ